MQIYVPFRVVVKVLQFVSSIMTALFLSTSGPHWILTLACLFVPPFGLYLVLRPVLRNSKESNTSTIRIMKERGYLMADIAMCLTMCCAFLGFAFILLYGYYKLLPSNKNLLWAAFASFMTSTLYIINVLITVGHLRADTVNPSVKSLEKSAGFIEKIEEIEKVPGTSKCESRESIHDHDVIEYNQRKRSDSDGHFYDNGSRYQIDNQHSRSFDSYSFNEKQMSGTKRNDSVAENEDFFETDRKIVRCIEELEENLDQENPDEKKRFRYWRAKSPRSSLKTMDRSYTDRPYAEGYHQNPLPPPVPSTSPPPLDDYPKTRMHICENAEVVGTYLDVNSYDIEKGHTNNRIVGEDCEALAQLGNNQKRRFASRHSENLSKRRFHKLDENGLYSRHEKSSDEESTSGSMGSSNYYETSTTPERNNNDYQQYREKRRNIDMELTPHGTQFQDSVSDSENARCSTSFITDQTYFHSLPRLSSQNIYRSHSLENDFRIYPYKSSEERRENFTNSRSRNQPVFNENGQPDPSFIPPIVAAIDSGRESGIIRQCFPRRTSSRTKKINSRKGFEVVIRAQNDDEHNIPRTPTPDGKMVESCFVTEF